MYGLSLRLRVRDRFTSSRVNSQSAQAMVVASQLSFKQRIVDERVRGLVTGQAARWRFDVVS